MPTRSSANTFFPDPTVVANLRAMAQFIEDTLVTTGGWVVTTDTGQTLPSALAAPSAANQKMGYRIYRMADLLQSSSPVFMRIDFGSNWNAATCPGLWITLGTGSNGAGVITGPVWTPTSQASVGSQSTSTSQVNTSYGSADVNRFTIALFINNNTSGFNLIFGVERTKDSSGANTAEGLLFLIGGGSEGGGNTNYIAHLYFLILAGGTQPAVEGGLSYVVTAQSPTQSYGGDIGVGPPIPFKGVAQQPGVNWMITNTSDVGVEAAFTMTIYGVAITYKQLNMMIARPAVTGGSAGTNDSNSRICMRYD